MEEENRRTEEEPTGSSSEEEPTSQGSGRRGPTRGTAPSAPDIRKLELLEPSDEAKAAEPSTVDAMGMDKRREVIGQSYGPTAARQALFWGLAVGIIALLAVGGVVLTNNFDKAPETNPDKAPWSAPDAPQQPAKRPQ